MTSLAKASLSQIASELSQALVRVSSNNEAVRLSLPLVYPGGRMVGVEISRLRDGFLVSDGGIANREAELLGGQRSFARIARDIAQKFGVCFDSNMIFDFEISEEGLLPAVVAVANAAQTAVENTALHMASAEHADYRAYLWDKLEKAYGAKSISRNPVKIKGAAEEWEFDAAIQTEGKFALFEMVTPNANSVNSAVTKFLDVRDLGEAAPSRVAVLTDLKSTPRLPVLGRTARILQADASDEDFRQAA
jgi:hypothetical protein